MPPTPIVAILSLIGAAIAAAVALYSARKTLSLQREMSERLFREKQFNDLRNALSLLLYATNPDLNFPTKEETRHRAICDILIMLDPMIDSHARLERHLLALDTASDVYAWREELVSQTRSSLQQFNLPVISS